MKRDISRGWVFGLAVAATAAIHPGFVLSLGPGGVGVGESGAGCCGSTVWIDDGYGGNNCCEFPESLEDDASVVRDSFKGTELQSLLDQQILETLCENHGCGVLSETQASQLLDRMIASRAAAIEAQDRREARWTARIGVVFAAFGLLISWLALRQSAKAERQSARNEVEIEHLKSVPE